MDPLSALGLAGNIVQFVDFSWKLVAEGRELYQSSSGALQENEELKEVTSDLERLVQPLASASTTNQDFTQVDIALVQLAERCIGIAKELLRLLATLKMDGRSKLEAVRKALRTKNKGHQIKNLEDRLQRVRNELDTRLLFLIRDRNSTVLKRLTELKISNDQLQADSVKNLDKMQEELVKSIQVSRGKTEDVLGNIATSLFALVDEGKAVAKRQQILRNLQYDVMEERRFDVKDAHSSTFEWLFESPNITFRDWLSSGDGTYWISGKAGSGKSTLIKHILADPRTETDLLTWAGSSQLITASHFFWNSGNRMQKSQEGLLRSLLYQILKQCPISTEGASEALRNRVEVDYMATSWSLQLLSEFLELLSTHATTHATKICIFIDGLDEYEGDHQDIIYVLNKLSQSRNIKLCVSSRPWNVFDEAYGNVANKLSLHEHSGDDIRRYVDDLLGKDDEFCALAAGVPAAQYLVGQIVDKAHGVFLWVFIVVRQLLEGVRIDKAKLRDLQNMVDDFPEDLEKLFQRILNSIPKTYHNSTARALQATLHAITPLPLMAYSFLDEELDDPNFALRLKPLSLDNSDLEKRQTDMTTRINARCKDFLEIRRNNYDYEPPPVLLFRVEFLHRTVRDFLETREMRDFLDQKIEKDPVLDVRQSLCRALFAVLKCVAAISRSRGITEFFFDCVDDIMHYAEELEHDCEKTEVDLLDELDSTMDHNWPTKSDWLSSMRPTRGPQDFIARAIGHNLYLYVRKRLEEDPKAMRHRQRSLDRPYLDYALRPHAERISVPESAEIETVVDPKLVHLLLTPPLGVDPNCIIVRRDDGKESTWCLFLEYCIDITNKMKLAWNTSIPTKTLSHWYQFTEDLIAHGADPTAACIDGFGRKSRDRKIVPASRMLGLIFPADQCARLELLLEQKRTLQREKMLQEDKTLQEAKALQEEISPQEGKSLRQEIADQYARLESLLQQKRALQDEESLQREIDNQQARLDLLYEEKRLREENTPQREMSDQHARLDLLRPQKTTLQRKEMFQENDRLLQKTLLEKIANQSTRLRLLRQLADMLREERFLQMGAPHREKMHELELLLHRKGNLVELLLQGEKTFRQERADQIARLGQLLQQRKTLQEKTLQQKALEEEESLRQEELLQQKTLQEEGSLRQEELLQQKTLQEKTLQQSLRQEELLRRDKQRQPYAWNLHGWFIWGPILFAVIAFIACALAFRVSVVVVVVLLSDSGICQTN